MHTVKLKALYCHIPDESDLDEIYLKLNGNKIWPEKDKYKRLEFGETEVNLTINDVTKGDVLKIEIWDYDILSKDDHLGTFHLILDQFGGGFETEMRKTSGTKASYSLGWEFY